MPSCKSSSKAKVKPGARVDLASQILSWMDGS